MTVCRTTLESPVVRQQFEVPFRYPVHFTHQAFDLGNPILADVLSSRGSAASARALFVIDDGLLAHHPDLPRQIDAYVARYADRITPAGPHVVVPGGETAKNEPHHLQRLYEAIHNHGLCRHSYLIVIGGGAVVDLVGYAAGTAHRGIRLVRMPTTVLAQNDAGIGVKNSVNAFDRKNFLGTFVPPAAVINDLAFLTTLSDRDWRAGIAEAIKVALIKDASFFAWIEQNAGALKERDMAAMEHLVYRCAELHLIHIATAGDPFESGSSRPLDFGHWSAHKLEQLSGYRLRHGEAVAIGMAIDATYSHLTGRLARDGWQRIIDIITRLGFALTAPELFEPAVVAGLDEFREHLGGQLSIPLLRDIGRSEQTHEMDRERVLQSIEMLRDMNGPI